MFIGSFYNSLEAKGRLVLPKAFRQEVEAGFVLTMGFDGQLQLFRESDWQKELERLTSLSTFKANHRALLRFILGNASEVELDKIGRLSIPTHLLDQAKITKEVVIVGVGQSIELWDRDTYHQLLDNLTLSASEIAESIVEYQNA